MTTIVTPSVTYTTWTVGELSLPCDYSEHQWCRKAPAKWVLWVMCTDCMFAAPRLAGDDCKNLFLNTEDLIECPRCAALARAKDFIKRIDAI